MKKSEDISNAFEKYCMEHNLKRTIPRRVVFDLFYHGGVHFSVDEVFQRVSPQLPTVKEESIYRVLADFERIGFLKRMEVPGVIKYELSHFAHGHFVCTRCGCIINIKNSAFHMPRELSGGRLQSLMVYGLCPKCAKAEQGSVCNK